MGPSQIHIVRRQRKEKERKKSSHRPLGLGILGTAILNQICGWKKKLPISSLPLYTIQSKVATHHHYEPKKKIAANQGERGVGAKVGW